jgi:hypothetical protein
MRPSTPAPSGMTLGATAALLPQNGSENSSSSVPSSSRKHLCGEGWMVSRWPEGGWGEEPWLPAVPGRSSIFPEPLLYW